MSVLVSFQWLTCRELCKWYRNFNVFVFDLCLLSCAAFIVGAFESNHWHLYALPFIELSSILMIAALSSLAAIRFFGTTTSLFFSHTHTHTHTQNT